MPQSFLLFQAMAFPLQIVAVLYRWMPREVRKEIWWATTRICYPFAVTTIAITAVLDHTSDAWIARFCLPFWILMWVQDYNRDDDDDRWKKRRKRLAAKVKVVGRKLVVVPISS